MDAYRPLHIAVAYRIAPRRGHEVVEEPLGGLRDVPFNDRWLTYGANDTVNHYLELCHVNRSPDEGNSRS